MIPAVIQKAKQYVSHIQSPAGFSPTGLTKACYLDVIDKTVHAYDKTELEQKAMVFANREVDDLHACARITAAIGVLLAENRLPDYEALWIALMDACCRDAHIYNDKAAVDFAVKELMLAFRAMEKKIPEDKKAQWLADLKKVDPRTTYAYVSTKREICHNINIYNMAGEYLRELHGLTNTDAYFQTEWPGQWRHFDDTGMYIDPHAPLLYDITTRVQIQLITGLGYRGAFFEQLDNHLQNAGYMTLLMQSACFMLPYGGRSNQYLFNEALIAANCEYEAARHKRLGDLKTAGVYKRSAHLAAHAIQRWLARTPPRHIKNFFPVDSQFGTEAYGYYTKYMATLGVFIYIAFLFADDAIDEVPCPAELGGYVLVTSPTFHKVFANCMGHSIEIDTKAHLAYDSTGLGRYHKQHVPVELGLSSPFVRKPEYVVPPEYRTANLSICAGWDMGHGQLQFLSDLSDELECDVTVLEETPHCVKFSIRYSGRAFIGCEGVYELYTLSENGVSIHARLINPVVEKIHYHIPLFHTNGMDKADLLVTSSGATVTMGAHTYRLESDAVLSVEPPRYANRNGVYGLATLQKNEAAMALHLQLS